MYNVLDVAKYVIQFCREKGYMISNLKLQKILYFIQAEFLVTKDSPCFSEEIEAWDFGPVVPEVYHRYKMFGNSNILEDNTGIRKLFFKEDRKILDDMIEACSSFTASQLVQMTHNQSPWINAYKKYYNNIISKKSIKEFFSE